MKIFNAIVTQKNSGRANSATNRQEFVVVTDGDSSTVLPLIERRVAYLRTDGAQPVHIDIKPRTTSQFVRGGTDHRAGADMRTPNHMLWSTRMVSDDEWNGSPEPLLQDEEEARYLEYLRWLAEQTPNQKKGE